MRMILAAVTLLVAGQANADTIYRCVIDGQLVFSQQPCADDADRVDLERRPEPEESAQLTQPPTMDDPLFVERTQLQRRILRHENRIRELQRARDLELQILRVRMRSANNNLAGATYLQALSTEMQAVTDSYSSRINVEQRQVERLRQDLAQVGN